MRAKRKASIAYDHGCILLIYHNYSQMQVKELENVRRNFVMQPSARGLRGMGMTLIQKILTTIHPSRRSHIPILKGEGASHDVAFTSDWKGDSS